MSKNTHVTYNCIEIQWWRKKIFFLFFIETKIGELSGFWRVKQESAFTFFYHVLIFFMGMTNIITLFSVQTIKLENGLYNLDYNSRTVYTIFINDTPKDAYENCLQDIFFICSRIYGSKFSRFFHFFFLIFLLLITK